MRDGRSSQTAAWVATARTLGQLLPRPRQLAHDPYGIAFATGIVRRTAELLMTRPALFSALAARLTVLRAFVAWMQLRTRALDDVLLAFLESGGRQVVLLGAGYDCRAVRFAHLLREATFLEVDHPSTQAYKRETMAKCQLRSGARYLAWDFERDGLSGLAPRLRAQGLRGSQRVLTIWEGVTMYLSEAAISETLALVHALGAPDSWLAFNYVNRRSLELPREDQWLAQRLAKSVGEPFRFGWEPVQLPSWLSARGYRQVWDRCDLELEALYLPGLASGDFTAQNRRVVLATTVALQARI